MEVRIQKFETQYRLAPWARAEQRRLDQVRTIVLDRAFEWAWDQVGMREEAELCIRNLFVPVRLSLRGGTESIIATWSAALGEEIARAMHKGSTTNVVVYHSHRQALMDLALGVARGDLSRAWAWRQLGLWRSRDIASESEAVVELVRALSEASAIVVPLLNALAHAGWLQRIASRLTATQWEQLAWAALSEAGGNHLLDASGTDHLRDAAVIATSARALRDARRVLKSSLLLRAITSAISSDDAGVTRRAIAALAVMDAYPSLLRCETAQTVVGIIADAIAGSTTAARTEIVDGSLETQASSDLELEPVDLEADQPVLNSADSTGADVSDAGDSTARNARSIPPDSSDLIAGSVAEGLFAVAPPAAPDVAKRAARRAAGVSETGRKRDLEAELDSVGKRNREETELLDLRRRGFTRFGGLLFLLAVIEDLKIPEQIMAHALLGTRPFLWVVHQLALALALVEAQDPAALAFAGLPPGAKPPSEAEEAPSPDEASALSTFVAGIVARLRSLLESEDEPDAFLLESVCRRRAEIVADPGWIEVRLSLDDVVTEIRRAGLDLNPGYVPWLGVVVVFTYE